METTLCGGEAGLPVGLRKLNGAAGAGCKKKHSLGEAGGSFQRILSNRRRYSATGFDNNEWKQNLQITVPEPIH